MLFFPDHNRKGSIATVATLQNVIDSTFRQLTKAFENSGEKFTVGDEILGKMAGYCAWPARIEQFTQNGRRMKCYFYGSHNTGTVSVNQAIPFKDGISIIRLINIRNPRDFSKGVREVELQNGIPEELSALRELSAIE